MVLRAALAAGVASLALGGAVQAAECGPDRLGTHRTLKVSASDGPVGAFNYRRSLDLADKEVVLTFDDGPMPKKTPAVLKALADECVKATFFVVGSMVAANPDILRQTAAEGHSIGTHTWSHAYLNRVRSESRKTNQIAGGLQAANIVLGDEFREQLTPLFRFPGLGRNRALDRFVEQNGLVSMSIDIDSRDWVKQTPQQVLQRTLQRLEARGKGILLMHDIQSRTVAMLPEFLRELKERGYRIVHVTADPGETRMALANLAEPQTRTFQVVMARAKTRMQVLSGGDAVALAKPARVEAVQVAAAETGVARAGGAPGFETLGLRR